MNSLTTPTTPRTLLEAVNELLAMIRVSSVMSLASENLNSDAADAKMALDAASVMVQSRGWYFNRETGFRIDPEAGTDFLYLPLNTLKVTLARCASGDRLVERGNRLYNPRTQNFKIPEGAVVDCVVGLPFEELPSVARDYVTAVAARSFGIPKLPTGATFRYTEEYVMNSLATLEQLDIDYADNTLAESSPHFAAMRRR